MVAGILLVAVLSGGGAAWWFTARPSAAAEHQEAAPEPRTGLIPLDPFVVNLSGGSVSHFLRISLALVVPEAEAAEMEEDAVAKMRVRSELLEVLAQQTAARLVTPEGKAELKTALRDRATHALGKGKVLDVLFTDFLVQF